MSLHYLGKHEPGNCIFSVRHRHVFTHILLENVGGSEQNRSLIANVQSDDLWPSRMHAKKSAISSTIRRTSLRQVNELLGGCYGKVAPMEYDFYSTDQFFILLEFLPSFNELTQWKKGPLTRNLNRIHQYLLT